MFSTRLYLSLAALAVLLGAMAVHRTAWPVEARVLPGEQQAHVQLGRLPVLEVGESGKLVGTIDRTTTSGKAEVWGSAARAIRFTTGASESDWRLISIKLSISRWPTAVTPTVTLHEAGTGNAPGTLIATMTNPSRGTGMRTFSAPDGTVLEPNKTYAIQVTSNGTLSNIFRMDHTIDDREDPDGQGEGWSVADDTLTTSNQVTWDSDDRALKVAVYGEVLDPPGITITPSDVNIHEDGASTYAVVLDAPPAGSVVVTISDPTNNTDVTADPASLTFDGDDWDSPRTVTVSAAPDTDTADDVATVTHSVTHAGSYATVSVPDVSVVVIDDDGTDNRVYFERSSYAVDEGSNVTVTVKLTADAGSEVTVPITTANQGGVTDADYAGVPMSVTFGSGATEASFTINAAQDSVDLDGKSMQLGFDTLPSGVVEGPRSTATVRIVDDEVLGVSLSPASLTVGEGFSASYAIALNTKPSANITVSLASSDAGALSVSPSSLPFTPTTWSTPQTVVLRALEDADARDEAAAVTHVLTGGGYSRARAQRLSVTITDDETLLLGNLEGASYPGDAEAWQQETRGQWFDTGPADHDWLLTGLILEVDDWPGGVTPTIEFRADGSGYTQGDGNIDEAPDNLENFVLGELLAAMEYPPAGTGQLIFPAPAGQHLLLAPETRYMVFVKGDGAADSQSLVVDWTNRRGAATKWGPGWEVHRRSMRFWNGAWAPVVATLKLGVVGKPFGVIVSASSLPLAEGASGAYTLKLASRPKQDVVVAIGPQGDPNITASPPTLTFTPDDWADARRVTVVAAEDGDGENDTATIAHTVSSSDSDYARATPGSVEVTVTDPDRPPVISGLERVAFAENRTGTVTTYSARDPNGDALTWALSGADADDFAISTHGELTFNATPNHEAPADAGGDNVYNITVEVSDGGLTATLDVTVTVGNVDESPEVSGPPHPSIVENSSGYVGRYTASDPEGQAVSWSPLSGADATSFEIDAGGHLSFKETPDYEARADNTYEVTVRASDGTTRPGGRMVVVTITNVDEPPEITGPAGIAFDEGSRAVVASYSAADPEDQTVILALAGSDADSFHFNDGQLTFKAPPNYEAQRSYAVTIEASDVTHRVRQPVMVQVTNLDEAGTLTLSSQPQVGTMLTATLSDPDGSLSDRSWTWERGSGGSWTGISGATGASYTPEEDDEGSGKRLRVTVGYTDGHGPGKTLQAVSDVVRPEPATNDAPEFDDAIPLTRSVSENSVAGTRVGEPVEANDPDVGDTLSYTLSGNDADSFTITSDSGQIRVAPGALLDHEDRDTYSVVVTATDRSAASDSTTVTITVSNENESPEANTDRISTPEDTPVTIDVLANDEDPEGAALTVALGRTSLREGAPTLAADDTLLYTPAADQVGVHSFTYTISDGHNPPVAATVYVTVNPVNDAPKFASATAARSISETARQDDDVGRPVVATDVDNEPLTLSYSISGPGSANFEIERHTGQITVAEDARFDAATEPEYVLTVTVRDPDGESDEIEVTITVTARSVGPLIGPGGGGGPTGPTPSEVEFEWNVKRDIEDLASGHDNPSGSWSDGATLWLAENGDGADDAVYAYDLASGERVEDREFPLDQRNRAPRGVASDGTTVWVADSGQDRLFAYDLATGERLEDRDIVLAEGNGDVRGIWSDGTTMWVLNRNPSLFAYDLASGALLAEYALNSGNSDPRGLWSDGVTIWVSDPSSSPRRLFAYRVPTLPAEGDPVPEEPPALERVREEEFEELSSASNNSPRGIWSDGDVMYVADASDGRVYTYNMPNAIDARLASLALEGIDIGAFDPGVTDYEASIAEDVTKTTVTAEALQRRTEVTIDPTDADEGAQGHQVALTGTSAITVTVTSQDGLRVRAYRVALEQPPVELALAAGWTAIEWPGADGTTPAEVLPDAVVAVYAWDAAAGTWLAYFPAIADVPGLNTLTAFSTGQTYWVAVTKPVTWTGPGIGTAP